MADGSTRPITVEPSATPASTSAPASTSGSTGAITASGAAGLHIDGEFIADCSDPATAPRIHQIRDSLIRVEDPVGGGVGIGNLQSIVLGGWPEIGLDEATSFV